MGFNPSWAVLVTSSSGAVSQFPFIGVRGSPSGIPPHDGAPDTDVSSLVPFIAPETTGSAVPRPPPRSREIMNPKFSSQGSGHEGDFLSR